MHTIERELIKVTAFKARKFSDRQDYLKSILNAVVKLTEDDFNNLTDAAAIWANAAVEAHNIKAKELPDFDEAVPPEDEDEPEAEETAEDDAEGVTEAPDDEDDETEDEPDEEASEDELPQDQEADEEPEPEEKPKRNKKKPPAAKKRPSTNDPAEAITTGTTVPKAVSKLNRGSDEDVVFDKWGAMEGSKNSQALAMFEQGATTREVRDQLGGTYYNILKKMVQNGHKLNKEGAVITLVHADSNKPALKKKK